MPPTSRGIKKGYAMARNDNELSLDILQTLLRDPSTLKLPDPELVNYYYYENRRMVWIDLSVDASALEYIRLIVRWNMEDIGKKIEDRKPIKIMLFNYGGSFDLEWALIDAIKTSKTPVWTVNMGICASAAADVFIAGSKRLMMPNAKLMIHQGNAGFEGDAQKIFDQADNYKAQLEKIKKFTLENTKIPARVFNKHINNDWWLTANECMEYEVCDAIIETIDDVVVEMKGE